MHSFLTLISPFLRSSRRNHNLQQICWAGAWGHYGVYLLFHLLHSDGSQSSPFSLLMHALMLSGDSTGTKRKIKPIIKLFCMQGGLPYLQSKFVCIDANHGLEALKSFILMCKLAGHAFETIAKLTAHCTLGVASFATVVWFFYTSVTHFLCGLLAARPQKKTGFEIIW